MNTYKRMLIRSILMAFCLFFIIGLGTPVRAKLSHEKIRIGILIEQGYSGNDGKGTYGKYTQDYLNEISQYTNWKYEFIYIDKDIHGSSREILEMLKNGEIDIVAPIEISDDSLEYYDLTGYHYGMTYSILSVLTENMIVSETDYDTLNGLNIGVLDSDTKRIAELKRFCSSNDITYGLIEYEGEEELRDAIKIGEVDAVLGNSTFPMEDTRMVAKFGGVPYYFATKKGNVEIMNGLNRAMGKIDEINPYFTARLNKKYFVNQTSTLILTQAEKEYIEKSPPLIVLGMEGIASLRYEDENGELRGISRRVLDEISDMTGLVFEYNRIDSLDRIAENKEADLVCSIPYNYATHSFPDMNLSQPFLRSSTIFYLQSSLNGLSLEGKTYAAIKGSALPEGVEEENTIYFDTREESMDAVNSGQAEYGSGNPYSVAFYMNQNRYENIVTIPQENESREYSIGFINEDKLLASIINKSLGAIDENEMQNLVLDLTFKMEREITSPMILGSYSWKILLITFVVISLLAFGIFSNLKANIRLKIQNRRYEVLSEISNEYLYEYNVKKNLLILSEKCIQMFGNQGAVEYLHSRLKSHSSKVNFQSCSKEHDIIYEIKLPLSNGGTGIFKVISSSMCDRYGNVESFIGKLIDISKETTEKEILLTKAQMDGLTGLYNPTTSRELIVEKINHRGEGTMDALILLDMDSFKDINDKIGHYTGDQVLQDLAKDLKDTFRSSDIIGRIGGDEFCVYMIDIPSTEFTKMKCQKLNDLVYKTIKGVTVSVSMGIVFINKVEPYEGLFQKADDALYQAKYNGKGQFVVYREKEELHRAKMLSVSARKM